jgi:tetratricopeptide (TPR) repeat protein
LAALYIVRHLVHTAHQLPHFAINEVIREAVEQLKKSDRQGAAILELRYMDNFPVDEVANQFSISNSRLHAIQREAINATVTLLNHRETTAWAEHQLRMYARLDMTTNTSLFGVESHLEHLCRVLAPASEHMIVAIEGLGGIGKTSLAGAVMRYMIEHHIYDDVGWVTARETRLSVGGTVVTTYAPLLTAQGLLETLGEQLGPQHSTQQPLVTEQWLATLRRRLKAFPHLIVIDNLESLQDLEALLPTLQELAGPSKFLLTSRVALYTATGVYHYHMPELNEAHALQLIQRELVAQNSETLTTWSEAQLRAIVKVVGGNPLALRLVVGQAQIHEIDTILAQIRAAGDERATNLFTYIYQHAWRNLSAAEKMVLLAMTLVNPQGDDLATVAALSGHDEGIVAQTFNRLVTFSLIDVLRVANGLRYRIHSLTRTFLQEKVLGVVDSNQPADQRRAYFLAALERGLHLLLQTIRREDQDALFNAEVRGRALNLLDHALKEPTIWSLARELLLAMCPGMERTGQRDQWLPYLEQGVAISQAHGEMAVAAELALWIGQLHRLRSHFPEAERWLTRSQQLFTESNEPQNVARALNQLAYVAWSQHQNDQATTLAEAALALLPADNLERAMSLSALGLVAFDRQQLQAAEQYHRQALQLRQQQHKQREEAWSLQNLALVLRELGEFEVAIQYQTDAIDLLEQTHDPAHRAIAQMNLGIIYSRTDKLENALTLYAAAEKTFRAVGDEYNLAKLLVNQGIFYIERQDWQQAAPLLLTASHTFKEQNIPGQYLNALDGVGICYLEEGRFDEAFAVFAEIAAQLDSIKDTPHHPYIARKIDEQLRRAQAGLANGAQAASAPPAS